MRVKVLICLHIICCFLICPKVAFASAKYSISVTEVKSLLAEGANVYARVNGEDSYVFSDTALSDRLFQVPKTYYLKVFEMAEEYCRVAYCYEDYDYARAVYGYADCRDLLFTSTPPTGKSFPNVFPVFEGNGTFYKNNRFDTFYSVQNSTATDVFFYGYYHRDSVRFCYVFHSGRFGYYQDEVFEEITIPPHPDAMPSPQTSSPVLSESESVKETGGFFDKDANKVIFIAVSCIIAVCAVYLIFLPRKEKISDEQSDFDGE